MTQLKRDIDGNVISPEPKCMNCNRDKGRHKAKTLNCPIGVGRLSKFCSFYNDKFYEPMVKKNVK